MRLFRINKKITLLDIKYTMNINEAWIFQIYIMKKYI